jgi:oligo-alginate lyase
LAEAARRNGTDLYANDNYRSLFDGPIGLALPDGEPPGFNDNPGVPLAEWNEVYELAYARLKVPEHGRVLRLGPRNTLAALLFGEEKLPEGDPIPKRSVLFRKSGFAALRSREVTVAVRFGLHGGGHGHPDMLNVVTFADGKLFGVDPGSIGYGSPLHREWYRSTIGHNTISVDQQIQSSADGHLIEWSQNVEETLWKGSADVYPGVALRRELKLKGQRITELFACESATEHVYDWVFHCSGRFSLSLETSVRESALGDNNGYQHLKQLRQAATHSDWTAQWVTENVTLTLRIEGEPGTTILTGVGPGRKPDEPTPFVIIRRTALKTVFAIQHEFGVRQKNSRVSGGSQFADGFSA